MYFYTFLVANNWHGNKLVMFCVYQCISSTALDPRGSLYYIDVIVVKLLNHV